MNEKNKLNEMMWSFKKHLTAMFLVIIISFVGLAVNAQNLTVTGTVRIVSGETIPGTTVVVKGTTHGTVTDFDGNYSISNVPSDAILQFSFVGMKTQEVLVDGKNTINVTMEEETIGLEEVVAIGYGQVKKADLTGSVANIGGEELARKNFTRVSQSLQGTMPGIMVTRSSGAADASADIKVRGITTIGDSNPLVIVDGVPGTLDWVNPSDIESVTVLKDAASASIYGARAAAGVIIIETKLAKKGEVSLNFDYNYTFETPTRLPQYLDAVGYMKVFNEVMWNDNNNIPGNEYNTYPKDLIENYPNLHQENPDLYPDTDWLGLMLKDNAKRSKYSLSFNYGGDISKSFISLVYEETEGLYKNKSYDRFTLRANNKLDINKYLSLNLNFNTIYSNDESPFFNISPSWKSAPVYAPYWSDGRIAPGKTSRNEWARLNFEGSRQTEAIVPAGKAQLDFTPFNGLKFSAIFAPEFYISRGKDFRKKLTYTEFDNPNTEHIIENATYNGLSESRTNNYSTTTQFLLNYNKNFNNHGLDLLAGFEEFYHSSQRLYAGSTQMALAEFPYLDLANENYLSNSGNAVENAYKSVFGRIMYNYDNRYLIQANARYDGSSRFHRDYRWGLFPSLSLGWNVSEESFMEDIDFLSMLKIRPSYGTLGNERIGNYPYQSTIFFDTSLLYQGNDAYAMQNAGVRDYAIRDISWETTEVFNIGLDAGFFDNRLRFNADYYKKITRDMLLPLEIPDYIGLGNPDQNTGEMHTNGWEFIVFYNNKIGELKYSISANISDSKTIMGDLGGTEFLGSQIKVEGSEFNEWYGYVSEGLFQTQEEIDNSAVTSTNVKPGDIKYKDISGPEGEADGKITPEYDRIKLGGSLPRYLYGGNIDLQYKNFDFSLVFQGVGKQNSQITTNMVRPLENWWMDVPKEIEGQYWSVYKTDEQNKNAKYPRVSLSGESNNYTMSDFWLFDGSYFRIKNVMIGYNIPVNSIINSPIKNARVYMNVSDLFSIDNYPKGWDPEGTSYWITRAFNFGVSVKF